MGQQDDFLALPRYQRELAYKVARAKVGPSHPLRVDELWAAHKGLEGKGES